jgi:hypothetical protein
METGVNLLTVGGGSAILYAVVSLALYTYLWARWGILTGGEPAQVLTMVGERRGEWTALWWGITIVPLALVPTFLAVFKTLVEREEALAGIALVAGLVALILGIIGPLRSATTTATLAGLYATGSEAAKVAALVVYQSGESYGRGLFCLFGAT